MKYKTSYNAVTTVTSIDVEETLKEFEKRLSDLEELFAELVKKLGQK